MAKYESYTIGECFGTTEKFEAKTDQSAKRMARQFFNPYQSNWQWYGSVVLENMETNDKWILRAGESKLGWQNYTESEE